MPGEAGIGKRAKKSADAIELQIGTTNGDWQTLGLYEQGKQFQTQFSGEMPGDTCHGNP